MLGVLVSAGAAICLAPCGSVLDESNPGQALNAVTGFGSCLFRSWNGFDCALPFVFMRLPSSPGARCCATVRTLLRSPRGDAAALPVFSRSQRWLASFRFFLLVPLTSDPSA